MRVLPLLIALFAAQAPAATGERHTEALVGLGRSLCVQVEEPSPEARQAGLSAQTLKVTVAQGLTGAGLEVSESAAACLRLSVRTHMIPATGFVSHYVELALVEDVTLVRSGASRRPARTWLHGTVGTSLSGRLESAVVNTALSSLAVFLDDYQLANSGP